MPELNVLFSDNHLLVVDKPAGISTMGAEAGTPTIARQAAEYLQRKHNKPGKAFIGVVSRLDRLVSGVLVLARTSKAASRLSEQIREQNVAKFYLAVAEGKWPTASGETIELVDWVAKDETMQRMRVVSDSHPTAQLARLRVQSLASCGQQQLLKVELLTGRKHQIRLQLAEFGLPIRGDHKYGAHSSFTPGIALHCQQLTITHPTLKEPMTFRSSPKKHWKNIPAEFQSFLS